MLEANPFNQTDLSVDRPNPYSADRNVRESNERQIPKMDPAILNPPSVDETHREFTDEEQLAMRSVKIGLYYYYNGIYLATFCFFVSGFLGRAVGPFLAVGISYGTFLGVLIVLYGELRCLAIPRETGGFKHVLLSVLFYSVGVFLSAFKYFLLARGQAMPGMVVQVGVLQLLVGFLANFYFLTFIICLTRFMQTRSLFEKAVRIRRAIWSMIGFMLIVFFVAIVMLNQLPQNGRNLVIVVLGLGILGFVILVYSWLSRFTKLVQETCSAIQIEIRQQDQPDSFGY